MTTLDRLDLHNRVAIERLLSNRARRLAALNDPAHRQYWPRNLSQIAGVTLTMADELAETLGDHHPHVRWLRGD